MYALLAADGDRRRGVVRARVRVPPPPVPAGVRRLADRGPVHPQLVAVPRAGERRRGRRSACGAPSPTPGGSSCATPPSPTAPWSVLFAPWLPTLAYQAVAHRRALGAAAGDLVALAAACTRSSAGEERRWWCCWRRDPGCVALRRCGPPTAGARAERDPARSPRAGDAAHRLRSTRRSPRPGRPATWRWWSDRCCSRPRSGLPRRRGSASSGSCCWPASGFSIPATPRATTRATSARLPPQLRGRPRRRPAGARHPAGGDPDARLLPAAGHAGSGRRSERRRTRGSSTGAMRWRGCGVARCGGRCCPMLKGVGVGPARAARDPDEHGQAPAWMAIIRRDTDAVARRARAQPALPAGRHARSPASTVRASRSPGLLFERTA